MAKRKVISSKTKPVVAEPFSSFLPGPRYETTLTYAKGKKVKGCGSSKTSSRKNAAKRGSGGGCYLTTACTMAEGLPDDCHELTTLRRFRDQYLLNSLGGSDLVAAYYTFAPAIVSAIERSGKSTVIFNELYHRLVRPCVNLIEKGDYRKALDHYMHWVNKLKMEFIKFDAECRQLN